MIIFYYTILLVVYCWIDEFILFGNILHFDEIKYIDNPSLKLIHNFSFIMFLLFLIMGITRYNPNKLFNIIYVGLTYLKYTSIFLLLRNQKIFHKIYEIRRSLMWLFTTFGMLDIYTKVNDIKLLSIKSELHFVPTIIHIFTYLISNKIYFSLINGLLIIPEIFFIFNLYKKFINAKYTNIFVSIWLIFGLTGTFRIFSLLDDDSMDILFSVVDLMAKYMVMIIIYDSEERKEKIKDMINLECVEINSNILQLINKYETNNISDSTQKYIDFVRKELLTFTNLNLTKDNLKIELLKKILPYEFEDKYLIKEGNKYQKKNNIFVLFLDIVSYSEIAKEFSDEKVFDILNNIYTKFDIVLRKYDKLQKIETIGDCYMIVSLLSDKINFITDLEYKNIVFKQLIDFSEELIELSSIRLKIKIRIGINFGSVVIGILGLDIPRLCIVGNTVNKASRLETTSEPNKINVSQEIYDLIDNKDNYDFEIRNNIYLKNIGSENTYFVSKKNIY